MRQVEQEYNVEYPSDRMKFIPEQVRGMQNIINKPKTGIVCTRSGGKTMLCALASMLLSVFYPHLGSHGVMSVGVMANSHDQTKQFKKHVGYFSKLQMFRGSIKNIFNIRIDYHNGSETNFYASSEDALRSPRNDWLFLDEAARIETEKIIAALPQLGGSQLAKICFLTTPAGLNSWAKQMWDSANYIQISWDYTRCPWLTPRFIETQKQSMSERDFNREYCCVWTSELGAVFFSKYILSSYQQPLFNLSNKRYVLGVDLGRAHSTALCLVEFDDTQINVLATDIGVWDFTESLNRIIEIIKDLNQFVLVAYEKAPISYSPIQDLRKKIYEFNLDASVKPSYYANRKERMVNNCEVLLEKDRIRFDPINNVELRHQLLGYHYDVLPTGISKYHKTDDDGVDAFVHAINATPLIR